MYQENNYITSLFEIEAILVFFPYYIFILISGKMFIGHQDQLNWHCMIRTPHSMEERFTLWKQTNIYISFAWNAFRRRNYYYTRGYECHWWSDEQFFDESVFVMLTDPKQSFAYYFSKYIYIPVHFLPFEI